ncbi:MAG: stage III sporulation protein AB [Firmicutes bacterium]|nr:stage III sporulation protein AB [Bacillota bacterium]
MLWDRWVGLVLVLGAFYGLGEFKASQTRRRVAELEEFRLALRLLSAEIGYTSTPLPRALAMVSGRLQREPVREFFLLAGEFLGGEGRLAEAAHSWAAAAERQRGILALTGDDWATLLRGAAGLGALGRSDQVRQLELAGGQLAELAAEAASRCRDGEKIWRYLGALAGLAVVILLL